VAEMMTGVRAASDILESYAGAVGLGTARSTAKMTEFRIQISEFRSTTGSHLSAPRRVYLNS